MQKIVYLLIFCLFGFWASGQKHVVQGEYFWDADPGQGNGTALVASDGNFDGALEKLFQNGIDVSALSPGAHNFSARIKGQDGSWSNTFSQTIYFDVPLNILTRSFNVAQGEYFWDGDPGEGNGIPLLALDGNFGQALEQLFQNGINVSALSPGAHNFSARIKGQDGSWSNSFKQVIYLDGPFITITRSLKVTQGEYFWDGDPGEGNGITLLALDGNFGEALETLFKNGIDVSAMSLGAHNFSARIKAQDGSWSNTFMQTIYLDGPFITITRAFKVTQGEYFWDTDPGQGNGTPLLATDGSFNTALENMLRNNIDVSTLTLGAHSFAVRTKGIDGGWSPLFRQTIFIECTSPTIPTISIAVTGNGTCLGANVQLTASVVNGGTAPSYVWKVNGIAAGTNSSVFNTTSLVNGDVVTCQLTSNSGCAGTLSVTSNSVTLSFTPSVVPTIGVTASSGNTICYGTPVTFTAAVTNEGNAPVYTWKVNNSVVGTNSNTFTSSTLNNGDLVKCELTSNAICAIPATVSSTAITMNVSGIATPAITISASASTICAGTNVIFNASTNGGGSAPVYQWKVNGNVTGTNSNSFSSATLNNGDVISCQLTSSLSCATTPTATSNNISMTVNPTVATAVTIASSAGTTICSGTNVTFTATPVNGGTPSYQWFVNGFSTGSNSAVYATTALNNGDVVSCRMSSSLSCPTPAIASSNGIAMTVNNAATPTASITSNHGNNICNGTNVTFTASVTNGGSAPFYQWYLNGSPVGSNSATYSTSTLANGNTISCVVTSNSPCVNGVNATSNVITVNVSAIVTPGISIAASATTICGGTSVTFTAMPTHGGTTPGYQWKVNGSVAGTNSASFSTSGLNNGDMVTCVLTTSENCVSTASVTSNSIAMTVNPAVSSSVSISSSTGMTVCSGLGTTFTATPVNGGTPVYQWSLNGLPVGNNSATYIVASLNTGDIIRCGMTSSLACATPAVASSNSITVNNSAAPTVSVTSDAGNSICSATSVTFTASVTNGGSAPTYQWYLNNVPIGTNNASYSNAALTNNDQVHCVVTSNSPCVNGTAATSNVVTMTVTPSVTTSVSIIASATTSCSGSPVTFTATPTNGGTPSYQWLIGSTNVGNNSSTFTSSTLVNGQTVTCQMTSSLGCATPAIGTSNAITMTINSTANPVITISSNPSAATICSGTNVTFTASSSNGGNAPVYQWKLNGTPVGTNASTYTSSTLVTGDAVTCELTSNAVCISTATVVSNSISKTVNPSITPVINITSNPAMPVCEHGSVTFTATVVNGGSAPSYQWKKNNQNYGMNATTYSTSLWNDGDVFTCVLTNNLACASSAQVTSNAITMDIVTPDAGTTVSGNTITANQAGATYQWYDCTLQVPIPGATGQSYTVTETGLYAVEITLGSCIEESGCELVNWASLSELENNGFALYPNPAKEYFTISLPYSTPMSMALYDVSGRKVLQTTIEEMQQQIDVHHLAPGSYHLILSDGNREYTAKVIVNQ